jgi:predicted HTH domain antitoxin
MTEKINIKLPVDLLELTGLSFERLEERSLLIWVLELYSEGKLTLSKAATLVQMKVDKFLSEFQKRHLKHVGGPDTVQEVQKDFDKIEKSGDYSEYVNSEDLILKFSEILEEFLANFFKISTYKPITCELLMFVFPGEDYEEPMIKIVYPDSDDFNNLEIRDDIEEKFQLFLVNESEDLEEYKTFRRVQKKFRFVIQRE